MKELKYITGEIQSIRKDRKAFSINNVWYSQFKRLDDNIQKGLIVEVGYLTNAKGYNNIESLDICKVIEEKKESNNVTEKIDYQTVDTLLLIAKDIYLAEGKLYADQEKPIPFFEEVLEEVFDAYNKVIRGKK